MRYYKLIIIMLFFLFTISFSSVYAMVNGFTLLGKRIYLDAGHGGRDSGALYKNILEKDINLDIVKKLEKELISRGAIVYLTRDGDYDLSSTSSHKKRSDLKNRANMINKSDCDLYLSIHLNYINDSKWNGLQVFYNDANKKNEMIANSITEYLKNNMNNVRKPKMESSYYMYRLINKPGVLIELGFLSNPHDRYILTRNKYQNKIILNLVSSIENLFMEKD